MKIGDADQIVADGKADIIAMGRPGLADDRIFVKGGKGLTDDDVRPCVRCSHCQSNVAMMGIIGCTVNPRLGCEYAYPRDKKAEVKKKVVIVGGGPAGMQAALTATERGHEVVLIEKNKELGGLLPVLCNQSFKKEFHRYMEWIIRETNKCGAKIVLNTEATKELIAQENPDVVMIAVGNDPFVLPSLPVDGQKVVSVEDVDLGVVKTGQKVLIAGGGVSGVECAMELADTGKEVTIVDIKPIEGWAGVLPLYYFMRMGMLQEKGVKVIPETGIVEKSENGVLVKNNAGETYEIEADSIVVALGRKQKTDLVKELSQVVPETYVIGSAKRDGEVYDATHSAYYAAMEI